MKINKEFNYNRNRVPLFFLIVFDVMELVDKAKQTLILVLYQPQTSELEINLISKTLVL